MCKEYNGYTNYQTWNVSLWIDNDQGLSDYFQEVIKETSPTGYELANQIKDFFTDDHPLIEEASMYADLLGHALASVNWDEIADNMLEE